jgi:hypothetical protein
MMTKNEALRIKHISQYCEEIGKDCYNCLFQDCFSKNEIRTAKSILGDWEEKEIYYLEEACRQWCDFIDEAPERKTGIGFYAFYQQIKQQKEREVEK